MSHGEFRITPILAELPASIEGLKIIDLGCGFGEVMYKAIAYSGMPWVHYSGKPASIVGVDVNDECLAFVKRYGVYDEVIKRNIEEEGLDGLGTYDLGISTEFLEHTHLKPDFLNTLKKIAKRIIISVPYGFTANVVEGITEFDHKSAWYPEDFRARGYLAKKYLKTPTRGRVLDPVSSAWYYVRKRNANAMYGLIATYDGGLS